MSEREGEEGTIVAHHGIAVAVRFPDGEVERIRTRRNSGHVVGERVRVEGGRLRGLPAHGVLRRRDRHGRVRAIAANLDALVVVVAPLPESPTGFVDRAIVAARAAGIEPWVVVNKCDRVPGADRLFEAMQGLYGSELPVLSLSAATGEGLGAIRSLLPEGRLAAFVGTSGVGKSSLLNALCPEVDLDVGEINEASGLGRHITSTSTLHRMPSGGEWIDTAGFRDFGPVEISARDLASHFPGFEAALAEGCRFRDCAHESEPGCAVLTEVEAGRIAPERHAGYLELRAELSEVERANRRS